MVNFEPLVRSRWAQARWLVLAPHPDDETLGAGALIAHAAATGRLGGIIFLTDGTGSHPCGTPRISIIRRGEAHCAIRRLGAGHVAVDWLDWQDANPFPKASRAFARTAAKVGALLRTRRIDAVAVSDYSETHCDHVAAYRLAEAAIQSARRSVSLFGYHVWSSIPGSVRHLATPAMVPGQRRRALHAHRSQLSPLLGDGFRLPSQKVRMRSHDILTLRSDRA